MFAQWTERLDPETLRKIYFFGQIALGAIFVLGVLWWRDRESPSAFGAREADRLKGQGSRPRRGQPDPLANARIEKKQTFRLEGIQTEGPPHVVLGVVPQASEAEIQKAYRELMKRYHPDLVGRPGSREWQDAQRIAEAINRAKEQMLARLRQGRG